MPYIVGLLLLFLILGGGKCSCSSKTKSSTPNYIQEQFSSWDGSHKALERIIKNSMNDPSSYEHVDTYYKELDNGHILVTTTFRGKNAFGGVVTNSMTAEFTMFGQLVR